MQGGTNRAAKCRPGMVIVGKAASGSRPQTSIRGRRAYGWIKCCSAVSPFAKERDIDDRSFI